MNSPVLRWLLLLVLVFDLVSAPFHAHEHDLGIGDVHVGSGVLHDADHEDDASADHVASGHLIAAVFPRDDQQRLPPPAFGAILFRLSLTAQEPAPSRDRAWSRAGTDRRRPSTPPHALPEGRAPPHLFA